ncbi:NUDIX domain-containing protein (plasmid) [Kitasatospora griseola]|uniref:NUDIX domain-containing protein n=1 Tax=Kitasatospora griseola TaxID=2064 RepID=UPI003855A396
MTDTTATTSTATAETGHGAAETIRYTADVAAVDPDGRVLLIERGHPPFQGLLALPGGHVDAGETGLAAAVRELYEETGVQVAPADLAFIGVYDEPDRDPRGRYVGVAYLARVPAHTEARAGDDAATVQWVPLDSPPEQLAFDHARILADARRIISGH